LRQKALARDLPPRKSEKTVTVAFWLTVSATRPLVFFIWSAFWFVYGLLFHSLTVIFMPILLFDILGAIKSGVKLKKACFLGKMRRVFGIMLLWALLYRFGISVKKKYAGGFAQLLVSKTTVNDNFAYLSAGLQTATYPVI